DGRKYAHHLTSCRERAAGRQARPTFHNGASSLVRQCVQASCGNCATDFYKSSYDAGNSLAEGTALHYPFASMETYHLDNGHSVRSFYRVLHCRALAYTHDHSLTFPPGRRYIVR